MQNGWSELKSTSRSQRSHESARGTWIPALKMKKRTNERKKKLYYRSFKYLAYWHIVQNKRKKTESYVNVERNRRKGIKQKKSSNREFLINSNCHLTLLMEITRTDFGFAAFLSRFLLSAVVLCCSIQNLLNKCVQLFFDKIEGQTIMIANVVGFFVIVCDSHTSIYNFFLLFLSKNSIFSYVSVRKN